MGACRREGINGASSEAKCFGVLRYLTTIAGVTVVQYTVLFCLLGVSLISQHPKTFQLNKLAAG